ncbi:MAG TPA: A/G-specific adenine glycosylase [Noviherbaspirillum sp.]|nr:A/G-specific adenine glycosylase [Noviherbaspirillum sp.]
MKRVVDRAPHAAEPGISLADPEFSRSVIEWQRSHGRHALPWQNTRDAYRIWLSEIMLQQTQVSAVIPYYLRFLERFPDVAALAAGAQEDVMAHWSGLGYYSRARNLHRCAQRIVAEYGGSFPRDPAALAALPGIGRSTAAAIAAFAYGERAAILDGNVKRVFCRVFGIEGFPGAKPIENALWERAQALLPEQGVEAYTQGLMDLGATVCTRGKPSCARCPLSSRCDAYASNRTHLLPTARPAKEVPRRSVAMLVIEAGEHVLLEQRPDSGIWGGLLSLPEIPAETAEEGRVTQAAARFGHVEAVERLQPFTHVFTHFRLDVLPFRVRLTQPVTFAGEVRYVWSAHKGVADAALPAPVKKLLLSLYSRTGFQAQLV